MPKLKISVLLMLFCSLITQSFCIYLPEQTSKEFTFTELMSLQKQEKQTLLEEESSAIHEKHIHHKSYDKFDDVVVDLPGDDAYYVSDVDKTTGDAAVGENEHIRNRRGLSDWLIAPNTRWCGRGNTANGTYNYLGGASAADKCCRKHDHCQLYIPAMSNRFELFNYRPYTLSHCHCDRRFRTCLKMANDEDANTIGKLFFNMVQTQCFKLRHEKVCQKRATDGGCELEFIKQKAYLKNNKRF